MRYVAKYNIIFNIYHHYYTKRYICYSPIPNRDDPFRNQSTRSKHCWSPALKTASTAVKRVTHVHACTPCDTWPSDLCQPDIKGRQLRC